MVLALSTVSQFPVGTKATFWKDNMSVLHAVLKGGGRAPETHAVVGQLRVLVADLDLSLQLGRVESKAHVADGLSRDSLEKVQTLQALFVEPVVPDWLCDPWADPLRMCEGVAS